LAILAYERSEGTFCSLRLTARRQDFTSGLGRRVGE
jgi:hypothetical protein